MNRQQWCDKGHLYTHWKCPSCVRSYNARLKRRKLGLDPGVYFERNEDDWHRRWRECQIINTVYGGPEGNIRSQLTPDSFLRRGGLLRRGGRFVAIHQMEW